MLEILAPAGDLECASAAINSGADAIYLGYTAFSARQNAGNFDESALRALLQKAHLLGVKVYVAMNTVVKNTEVEEFIKTALLVWNMGADAIILQDIFLGGYLHKLYPEIVLHASTQAGVCTENGAQFAKEKGFSRAILSRETPLEEIKKIAKIIETEVFVQGALCTCFSGQCYFSSFAGGNSGNRGRCKQPCRKLYAYDRNGNTELSYALSLSDLSVGENVEKLIEAGVTSFKIEGRMRRAEYVAAAVNYYRAILDKNPNFQSCLSDLKRTYNRGNYTKGLAFEQDKRLLSTAVQGHLGEKVGVVKVINGEYWVESICTPKQGDAFKILRNGKEVGGAVFSKRKNKAFCIVSKTRLCNGDGVFVTTDTALNERLLCAEKTEKLHVSLRFVVGEYAEASCGDLKIFSEEKLQAANSRPLTGKELTDCFLKTDGLPVEIVFENVTLRGDVFLPKSQLNAFRRKFYGALVKRLGNYDRTEYGCDSIAVPVQKGMNDKVAVIASSFDGVKADVAIYKCDDFSETLPESFINGNFEKYVYYPAFLVSKDEEALEKLFESYCVDGIYAENYAGVIFAKKHKLKLFAGVGFHLFNGLSIAELLQEEVVSYYALSKELNANEQSALTGEKAFVLSSGGIKIMDLCYCPFGKTCSVCDRKEWYALTDEHGRNFPVKRLVGMDGNCRFEVYNCAKLVGKGVSGIGKILDLTTESDVSTAVSIANDEEKQKLFYGNYTSGHAKRGVL
ncbi:MAG: U32 family peptidase [Clostridia bacterium]|nr:U32 family peptidase [Clostridia bacterium]